MSKQDFLPSNYELPETASNYMRFKDGINRFRILGSAVTGFEYFTSDNKPVRSKEPFEETPNLKKDGKVKAFWAFPIWNYQVTKTESGSWIGGIQVLELTQKTIMKDVKALVDNPKWGVPFMYDIAVTRTGEGLDTEYSTMAEPPLGEADDMIKNEYSETPINLEALFANDGKGEDPFKV